MRKRLISVLMTLILLISFITSAACGVENAAMEGTEMSEQILTREQWIIGLGSVFGMSEYVTEEPFFTDVDGSAEVYPFLQSCAEWGIFEKTGGSFEPEEKVTREYAVQTAVMAAEVLNTIADNSMYGECIPYAVEHGIIDSDKKEYLSENLTYDEGQKILDWAVAEYQNREFTEYSNVEIGENVIDISDCEMEVSERGNTVVIPSGSVQELQIGDVFIAPGTLESPDGVAKKVTSLSYDERGNQVVETTEPELEEVFKELDFAVRAIPDADDVIVSEGVTLASVENSGAVYADCVTNSQGGRIRTGNAVSGNEGNIAVGNGASFGFKIDISEGEPTISGGWKDSMDNLKLDIAEWDSPDQPKIGKLFEESSAIYLKNGDKPDIKVADEKYEGGYELTGEVKIENLYIDVVSEPEKELGVPVGIKDFYIKINCDAVTTLNLKGKLKEEISFATFQIPTTVPGMTITLKASLYVDANGLLQVKFTASNSTSVGWSEGRLKKVSDSSSIAEEVSMAVEIEPGVSIKAVPVLLGIRIIDVQVKAGVKYKFSSSVEEKTSVEGNVAKHEYIWLLTGKVTYPIVKLEVGSNKDDKDFRKSLLNIKFSYDIVGENAPISANTYQFFEEKTSLGYMTGEEPETEETELTEATETEETETEEEILSDSEMLDIESYMIGLRVGDATIIEVTSVPEGYTASDLRWESDTPDVATVSGGNVTAVGAGTAQIKVYTSDGKYQIFCTVIVSEDEEVEFHSL